MAFNIDKEWMERTIKLAQKEFEHVALKETLLCVALVFVLLMVICTVLSSMMKERVPWNSRVGYSLAGAYSIFIIEMAVFSREADSREGIFNNSMFDPTLTENEKILVFLNVIFFIPFGIALGEGMYHQMKLIKSVLLTTAVSFLFSLFVETTQHLSGRGYYEVADMQANTMGGAIGALVGALIGMAIYRTYRKKTGKNPRNTSNKSNSKKKNQ